VRYARQMFTKENRSYWMRPFLRSFSFFGVYWRYKLIVNAGATYDLHNLMVTSVDIANDRLTRWRYNSFHPVDILCKK
jgi:hypothetical protein